MAAAAVARSLTLYDEEGKPEPENQRACSNVSCRPGISAQATGEDERGE